MPFLALKAITDIVDGERPAQEEFLENLHMAAQALQVSRMVLHELHALSECGCIHPVPRVAQCVLGSAVEYLV